MLDLVVWFNWYYYDYWLSKIQKLIVGQVQDFVVFVLILGCSLLECSKIYDFGLFQSLGEKQIVFGIGIGVEVDIKNDVYGISSDQFVDEFCVGFVGKWLDIEFIQVVCVNVYYNDFF